MAIRRVTAFVDALLRNRRPPTFSPDAEDLDAMRAAIELHAAQPGATIPSSEFVADLHRRLAEQHDADTRSLPDVTSHRFSRRRLLQGVTAAAAAAAAGVLIDRELLESGGAQPRTAARQLVPDHGAWKAVTTRAELTDAQVVPFSTPTTVGFVVNDGGRLAAISGICTHQGCVLRHNQTTGQLDCPCHRASFSLRGDVLSHEFPDPLPPLPHLAVRQRDGQIEVFTPE